MVTESQLELSICNALARRGYFVVKLKDQAQFVNGSYRKGSSYQIRGVSDLVVFLPNGVSVWLEIKTLQGKQSDYQRRFASKIKELGHIYVLSRSVEDAIQSIDELAKAP